MSPEHYQTHVCYVKAIKSKHLTDTLQLTNKLTKNPTITHADKVMNTISVCAVTLKGVARGKTPHELHNVQQIVDLAGRTVSRNASAMKWRVVQRAVAPPRVQHCYKHTTTQITRSVTAAQAPGQRVETASEQVAPTRTQTKTTAQSTIAARPAQRMRTPTPTPRDNAAM